MCVGDMGFIKRISHNLNVWDESDTDGAGCSRKVTSGRRVTGTRSLVNARDLQLECVKVLHETLLVSDQRFARY